MRNWQSTKNIEELADLLEVIYAAAEARGYSLDDLEAERLEKADRRGGFKAKLLLESVVE